MLVREATASDTPGILQIYNHVVTHSTAIWNHKQLDISACQAWINDRQSAGYPVLVAAEGDRVLGYATFVQWRPWDGYRHTVEHSVSVDPDYRRQGVGAALVSSLIERATDSGIHVMVAGIEAGNSASISLHQKIGFKRAATLVEVGTKFGRWLDLTFMQLILEKE